MSNFIEKMRGDGAALPARANGKSIVLAGIGGFVAIAVVALPTDVFNAVLVLGSFGASCVLVFGFPDAPFSQPRNVIGGHFLSSLIGLSVLFVLGNHWWAMALAVALAIMMMMVTRTVHPPAGSNPVIVFLTQPSWGFLLFPTLIGAVLIVVVALIYNNATRDARYPKYW